MCTYTEAIDGQATRSDGPSRTIDRHRHELVTIHTHDVVHDAHRNKNGKKNVHINRYENAVETQDSLEPN